MKFLPNLLTIIRLIMIPLIIYFISIEESLVYQFIASFLFSLAAATDFMDGYIAKRFNFISKFGTMLDPIADKLIVIVMLIMLIKQGKVNYILCLLIISREVLIAGIREYLAHINYKLPVSAFGKLKTFFQMTSIPILMIGKEHLSSMYLLPLHKVAILFFWISAFFSVVSGYLYIEKTLKYLD